MNQEQADRIEAKLNTILEMMNALLTSVDEDDDVVEFAERDQTQPL